MTSFDCHPPKRSGPVYLARRPEIVKNGTIACDLVEANPVVWQGRLMRFESLRRETRGNTLGRSCFHFVDWDYGTATPPFGIDYQFGCAYVAGNRMIVTGATAACDRIDIFESTDLTTWECRVGLGEPRYRYFNTSLCHDGDRYVLLFEINAPPEECGIPFTARFAFSRDLRNWEIGDPGLVYSRDRYTAPHCLRFADGYYYLFYLEQYDGFGTRLVRSRDLRNWYASPLDPVLKADARDHEIANPELTTEECRRITKADNWNNSDIDMIEWMGGLVFTYSWGTQSGVEHLATARCGLPLKEFLGGWFI